MIPTPENFERAAGVLDVPKPERPAKEQTEGDDAVDTKGEASLQQHRMPWTRATGVTR